MEVRIAPFKIILRYLIFIKISGVGLIIPYNCLFIFLLAVNVISYQEIYFVYTRALRVKYNKMRHVFFRILMKKIHGTDCGIIIGIYFFGALQLRQRARYFLEKVHRRR